MGYLSCLAIWEKADVRQKELSASQLSKDLEAKLTSATKEASQSVHENKALKEKLHELEKLIDESRRALQVGALFYLMHFARKFISL